MTSTLLGGCGDDDYNNDVRWEEQDMPYLSHDWQRAEGGEGDIDDGVDDEHVDDSGDCGATVTTMMTSRRKDRIPPR